jgi:hypothetical protein
VTEVYQNGARVADDFYWANIGKYCDYNSTVGGELKQTTLQVSATAAAANGKNPVWRVTAKNSGASPSLLTRILALNSDGS